MNIFKRDYTLRRFSHQSKVRGYAAIASYKDIKVSLNVQPMVSTELKSLAEGDRATKGVKSYGDFPVTTADPKTGARADRLFYAGEWYESVSSSFFEHTPLGHWKSQYVRVSEADDSDAPPTEEVQEDDD